MPSAFPEETSKHPETTLLGPTVFGIKSTSDRSKAYLAMGRALDSGLPIPSALRLLEGPGSGAIEARLAGAATDLERGSTLGEALRQKAPPALIPREELRLIEVGENTGMLPDLLRRMSQRLDERANNRRTLVAGLIYPAILVHMAILAGAAPLVVSGLASFLGSVVPKFVGLWAVVLVTTLLIKATLARPNGRRQMIDFSARLPTIGRAVQARAMAEYAHVVGVALSAGLPIQESIQLGGEAGHWTPLSQAAGRIATKVTTGASLSQAHQYEKVMPRELVESVRVGEAAGSLEQTFEGASRMLADIAKRRAAAIAKTIPVAIYLLVAIYVGFVVISGFTALMELPEGI